MTNVIHRSSPLIVPIFLDSKKRVMRFLTGLSSGGEERETTENAAS